LVGSSQDLRAPAVCALQNKCDYRASEAAMRERREGWAGGERARGSKRRGKEQSTQLFLMRPGFVGRHIFSPAATFMKLKSTA